MDNDFCHSAVWLALSMGARCLLIQIWSWHNGFNNGAIRYGIAQAAKDLGCSPRTAIRYFAELKAAGLIEATERGHFDSKKAARMGQATAWNITLIQSKDDYRGTTMEQKGGEK